MAHADYGCCFVCDKKLEPNSNAMTKEAICGGCQNKIRKLKDKVICSRQDFIKLIDDFDNCDLKKFLKDVNFRVCHYPNFIDSYICQRIVTDENRYIRGDL